MKISYIKDAYQNEKEFAESIMDGEDNYDGADGARVVLELCRMIEYLLTLVEN